MKQMILVPEDAYARFEQKLETSPIMKNMINSDTDMTNILQCRDVDTLISDNKKTVKHQPFLGLW